MLYDVISPFPTFTGLDGKPLEGGSIYIGTTNLNPETNPITVYWDQALTQPVAQPIRTVAGYPSRNGAPAKIYTSVPTYSITARNSAGVLVYATPNALSGADWTTVQDFINSLSGSGGSADIGFIQSGTGAIARTVQDELRERVSVTQFGATPDNVTNNYAAIVNALATGFPVHFPKTAAGNTYRVGTGLVFGSGAQVTMDDGVVIYYTGSTGAGITLTGTALDVQIGEVYAPLAPYAIKYYNLEYSSIAVRRPGSCTAACIYHDGDAQTANAGNNRWIVEDIQAGSVPYGVRIKNSATYTLEGEIWDIKVILSATTCALRIGEAAASNKCRWNTYRLAVDAQGITPILVDVYQDYNFIELINWAGLSSPPVAHVRFNTGTGNNLLIAGPGIQDPIKVVDDGTSRWFVSGNAQENIFGGKTYSQLNSSSGSSALAAENSSSANNTTKYSGVDIRGRDTVDAGKDVGAIRAYPKDSDWTNSTLRLYARVSDTMTPMVFIGITGTPEGVITAPVGAIATRSDGGVSTTLYVKQSGTGNTGWVAK